MKSAFLGIFLFGLSTFLMAPNATAQVQWELTEATVNGNEPFPDIMPGTSAHADIDNDGDQDILLYGFELPYYTVARLFRNEGNFEFTEIENPFDGNTYADVDFGDVDNDGDLDLVACTGRQNPYTMKIYLNDGLGNYTIDLTFDMVAFGSVKFADLDGDNDQDLIVTGRLPGFVVTTRLFINNFSDTDTLSFSEQIPCPFDDYDYGAIATGDVDMDGDLDVYIQGEGTVSKIYYNEGLDDPGTAIEFSSIELSTSHQRAGIADFVDIDADGDLDLLKSTKSSTTLNYGEVQLYLNDGLGGFTLSFIQFMDGSHLSKFRAVGTADIDLDGDLDIISGLNILLNDGAQPPVFTEGTSSPVLDMEEVKSLLLLDFNGDGKTDLFQSGRAPVGFDLDSAGRFYANMIEPDTDGDGIVDVDDNCPEIPNDDQMDTDSDGFGDECDICPFDPNNDSDQDGICDDIDPCIGGELDENGDCIFDNCQDWVTYFNNNSNGGTDLYSVDLSSGEAELTFITTIGYHAHIAYNPYDNLIYVIHNGNGSYVKVNPYTAVPEISAPVYLSMDIPSITTAAFAPNGKLLVGTMSEDVIYSVNVSNQVVSVFDAFAPMNGGDIAFDALGMLYLATRNGNGFYEVYPNDVQTDQLIGVLPNLVTGMALTESGQMIMSFKANAALRLRNLDGSDAMVAYPLMLDGSPYAHDDGDMTSGCNTY